MAITTSILTGGTNNHETTSEEANAIATDFIGEGIVSTVANTSGVAPATGGFAVNAQGTPDMTVAVSSGVAYVQGTPSSQNSQMFRVKNSASSNVTISANSSGSTKYDWVYISLNATNLNTPNTAGDNVATLTTSRSSSASTDDGTPPTYGYALAVVTVANGASSISNSMIRDVRAQCGVSAGATTSSSTWADTGYTPGTVTYNGNRSYNLTVASADLTGFLSNGMRLKLTRTTAPPTQCTDLESGSSQYWSKASPNGTTFTDDFNAGAWIKLESYPATACTVISRYNGTSGWQFYIGASGQVAFAGYNGGGANFSQVVSVEAVPLGRWVHIAAQLDMSAFTATTTTSYIMIDGKDVPAAVSRGGTNPTALIQAGDLQVGALNGSNFFDGKIAQCWYSSAKITQATIAGYISQGMTGAETSIVSHYDFNGDANDNNANANNLSANGGAAATNVDSPFNSTEYGIITGISFSTNTTITAQVPHGYAIPTSGGLSSVHYSTYRTPYGFPSDKSRWVVDMLILNSTSTSGTTTSTVYNPGGMHLKVPVGAWDLRAEIATQFTNSTTTASNHVGISTSASSFNMPDMEIREYSSGWGGAPLRLFQSTFNKQILLTSETNYYVLMYANLAVSVMQVRGVVTANEFEFSKIEASLTYL
jgi:hypothetical protein